jgi:hypothetical protein
VLEHLPHDLQEGAFHGERGGTMIAINSATVSILSNARKRERSSGLLPRDGDRHRAADLRPDTADGSARLSRRHQNLWIVRRRFVDDDHAADDFAVVGRPRHHLKAPGWMESYGEVRLEGGSRRRLRRQREQRREQERRCHWHSVPLTSVELQAASVSE